MKPIITDAKYEIDEAPIALACNMDEDIRNLVELVKSKNTDSSDLSRKLYKVEHRAKRDLSHLFELVTGESEGMRDYDYDDMDDIRQVGYSWKSIYQNIQPDQVYDCLLSLRIAVFELARIALHDGYVPYLRREAKERLTEIEAILEALERFAGEPETQDQT